MFKAIGLVIGLIAVRVIMPEVFHAFEHAAVSFFGLLSEVFKVAPNSVTQMGSVGIVNYVPQAAPLPPALVYPY
jgi:hypothetical protein